MAGGREIKTKIKSVQNTRKVTRALEMVSASKIRKAQDRMKASRPYARLMVQLIGHIAKAKWLDIADLFYVGFHFAEQAHRAKEFGKHVLEIVVKRSHVDSVLLTVDTKCLNQVLEKPRQTAI